MTAKPVFALIAAVILGSLQISEAISQVVDVKCEDITDANKCRKAEGVYQDVFWKCDWLGTQCQKDFYTAKHIQEQLKNSGFAIVKPTGEFDQQTLDALKQFQMKNKLFPSGKPDRATIDALK